MSAPLMLRRLLPEPGSVAPAQAASHLTGREVLLLNMVTSLDGHTTIAGRSRAIRGGQGDRELFHALRAHADAILVGTGTMRAESYGAWLRDERRRDDRDQQRDALPRLQAAQRVCDRVEIGRLARRPRLQQGEHEHREQAGGQHAQHPEAGAERIAEPEERRHHQASSIGVSAWVQQRGGSSSSKVMASISGVGQPATGQRRRSSWYWA